MLFDFIIILLYIVCIYTIYVFYEMRNKYLILKDKNKLLNNEVNKLVDVVNEVNMWYLEFIISSSNYFKKKYNDDYIEQQLINNGIIKILNDNGIYLKNNEDVKDNNKIKYNIDDILDKIINGGINSLNKDEYDFLVNYSKN